MDPDVDPWVSLERFFCHYGAGNTKRVNLNPFSFLDTAGSNISRAEFPPGGRDDFGGGRGSQCSPVGPLLS